MDQAADAAMMRCDELLSFFKYESSLVFQPIAFDPSGKTPAY
jgi:hypothetical protein